MKFSPPTAFDVDPMQPLHIGGVTCPSRLVLAPMSGVTNGSFRRFIRQLNPGVVGLVVSEFISIEGLTRGNAQSLRMMEFRDSERPVSIQIFGHEIKRMVAAAQMVEASGANIVDINCGCPVPKVVKRGGGCELMRQPEHVAQMLTAVRRAVTIPLTLKMRAGWDERSRNALEIARIAEGCGVEMIALHGRTRQEMYRGQADWSIVSEVSHSVKIPVIGSGDVVDGPSVLRAFESSVAGVMIGRGALANPWIFSDITRELAGLPRPMRTPHEVLDALCLYTEMLREDLPDRAVLGRLKQLASQATRLIRGAHALRRNLCMASTVEEFLNRIENWRNEIANGWSGESPTREASFESGIAGSFSDSGRAAAGENYVPERFGGGAGVAWGE